MSLFALRHMETMMFYVHYVTQLWSEYNRTLFPLFCSFPYFRALTICALINRDLVYANSPSLNVFETFRSPYYFVQAMIVRRFIRRRGLLIIRTYVTDTAVRINSLAVGLNTLCRCILELNAILAQNVRNGDVFKTAASHCHASFCRQVCNVQQFFADDI